MLFLISLAANPQKFDGEGSFDVGVGAHLNKKAGEFLAVPGQELSLRGIVTNGWSNDTPANAFADVIGQIGPKCFESDSDLSQAISRSLRRVRVVGKLIGGYLGNSLCGLRKF